MLLIALWLGSFLSCVEDKGNNVLSEINEIKISGIEDRYDLTSYLETLNIEPEIECTLKDFSEDNLEYSWFFCRDSASTSNHSHEKISTERDLSYKVDVPPGTYTIYLQVTDKLSGLKFEKAFKLYASSRFVRGFYLYGDKADGTVGLDFVSMPVGKDTMLMKDIFINSLQVKGAKDLIFTGHYNNGYNALWAVTHDNQYAIEYSAQLEKVDIIPDKNIDDHSPGTYGPMCVSLSGEARSRLIITENEIFVGNLSLSEAYSNPINRDNANTDQLFKPYPVAFYSAAASTVSYACFFDMTNRCFKKPGHRVLSSATKCDKPSYDSDFVYAFTAPTDYSSDPIKHYAKSIDMSVAIDFARADYYAFFSMQSIILYSVDSKLYAYDYNRNDCKLIEDFGAQITYLAMEHQSTLSPTNFVVATYSDSGGGVVRKYSIADDMNTIKVTPHEKDVWETDLKVVKVLWKYSTY